MRNTVALCLLLASLLAVLALCSGASSGYQNGRNKPRAIRGFKNALNIARGFGKRDGGMDFVGTPNVVEQISERSSESFPVDWFVEELQNNPELARIIVHKFVDANQDGELSAEELLRPLY